VSVLAEEAEGIMEKRSMSTAVLIVVLVAAGALVLAIGWRRNRSGVTATEVDARTSAIPSPRTGAAREGIEHLRHLHDQLDQAVLRAEAVFSKLQLPDTRSPQRADLVPVFEQTKAIATALADLLDGLDRELGNEGSGVSAARLTPEEVHAFLVEVEPPPQEQGGFHPGVPRKTSAIGKLPGFYGYHVGLNNQLYEHRVPKSFAWRQTQEQWQTLVYFGGTHAIGGLLSRLDRISELRSVRQGTRSSEGGAVVTETDGQRVLKLGAVPPQESYPYDRRDIAELRRIAERAGFLATGADEALLDDERREWCKIIDDWLQAGSRVGTAGGTIIAGLIDEAPASNEAINDRLTKLAGLEYLGEEARAKARAKTAK
jgi:hypothetical protein